jgi:hypothetical protein
MGELTETIRPLLGTGQPIETGHYVRQALQYLVPNPRTDVLRPSHMSPRA